MLDAFKNRTADHRRGGAAVDERRDLERLIQDARAERTAMDDTLCSLRARAASLKPIGEFLERIDVKVAGVTSTLEQIGERLARLDGRTRELEEHVHSLNQTTKEAVASVDKAAGIKSDLDKHQATVEQLSAQARETEASFQRLRTEHAALETLRDGLRAAQTEIEQSVDRAGVLQNELNVLRSVATGLSDDCSRIGEASRKAREDTGVAMTAIQEVEKKLGPLVQLQELGQDTEERLVALTALAERLSVKAKVIESQQPTVEHALVQANRVNEMVWSMDVQIGKLNEGMKQAATAEETLARLDKLAAEATGRLAAAAKLSEDTQRQTARLEQRGALLLESLHAKVGALDVDKKELDTIGERLRVLSGALDRAEGRMAAFASQEQLLATTAQAVGGLTDRVDDLFAHADELAARQLTLQGLSDKLSKVDDLAARVAKDFDWLREGREELDALRNEVTAFRQSHTELGQLSAALAADRHAIDTCREQLSALSARAPEVEAKVGDILGRMSVVERASGQAAALEQFVSNLNVQLSRLESRASVVQSIEARLNALHALSSDVDRRLAQQLEARNQFDTFKAASDGIAVQVSDAQHKLDALAAMQAGFMPLVEQVRVLRLDIDATRAQLDELKPNDAAADEYERRFATLTATSRQLEAELAERQRNMNDLAAALAGSDAARDALHRDLELVQGRQRQTAEHLASCDEQLTRIEGLFNQLDKRRVQISSAERKLAAIEGRIASIRQTGEELDRRREVIADREQLVSLVQAQVEAVHQIGARSKADLEYVMHHRSEVLALRTHVDQLLSRLTDTDERLTTIDARRPLLDAVESKASRVLDLLDDMRINVQQIGEHKAVVDHVAQTAAQLEFRLQEARSVLETLQHEREQVERLEQGMKQLSLSAPKGEESSSYSDRSR